MSNILVDYPNLLDPDYITANLGMARGRLDSVYEGAQGLRHSSRYRHDREVLEVVRLDRDVLLILNHCLGHQRTLLNQFVGDGKWVHIQFCLAGSGSESLGETDEHVLTSTGMCTITSYADSTIVARDLSAGAVHKTACLYFRPQMLERFFRVPPQALPESLRWMSGQAARGVQHWSFRMHPSVDATVNDMLACSYRSHARLGYMQAKSTELMATMLHSLVETPAFGGGGIKLSLPDLSRLSAAKRLLEEEVGAPLSLTEIAACVGLNRSKLTAGFRDTFGVTIQGYSRDLRLSRAKDLLRAGHLSVTDVAERMGYSKVSSFTRAFREKYGISPKQLRSSSADAAQRLLSSTDPLRDESTRATSVANR